MTGKLTKDHQKSLLETLKDPREAAAYLNAALEEDDNELFLLALKNVVKASGVTNIARKTHLNRENLYKMLSEKGNPELTSLWSILSSIGLKISIDTVS
ncbi:MAG: putative addiction module antidote protein [Candidatus Riflebacteria bacterium]|nr:putative addiction module antidote protein [Candidatus Riflebacteria bacterium]